MVVDHVSTCDGLKWAAIANGGSADLTAPPIVSLVAVTMDAEEITTHQQQERASAP